MNIVPYPNYSCDRSTNETLNSEFDHILIKKLNYINIARTSYYYIIIIMVAFAKQINPSVEFSDFFTNDFFYIYKFSKIRLMFYQQD